MEHSKENDRIEDTGWESRREVGLHQRNVTSAAEALHGFGETERALVHSVILEITPEAAFEKAGEAAVPAADVEDPRTIGEKLFRPRQELSQPDHGLSRLRLNSEARSW